MKRLVDVTLNGAALSSVHAKILGIRVLEQPTQDEVAYENRGMLPGQRVISKKRTGLNITVVVKVRELYDLNTRMDVINAVNTWAAPGGEMKISYRRDMSLNVALIQSASPGDIRDYNTEIELVFTANGWPFWKGAGVRYQLAGASSATTMQIQGSAPALVDAAVYVIRPITKIALTVGETNVRLTGMDIPAGGYFTLTHNEDGVISVMFGDTSLYQYLSADSGDCLASSGGSARASYTTDGDAEVTFSTSGRWL